jgi:hypothetical protein
MQLELEWSFPPFLVSHARLSSRADDSGRVGWDRLHLVIWPKKEKKIYPPYTKWPKRPGQPIQCGLVCPRRLGGQHYVLQSGPTSKSSHSQGMITWAETRHAVDGRRWSTLYTCPAPMVNPGSVCLIAIRHEGSKTPTINEQSWITTGDYRLQQQYNNYPRRQTNKHYILAPSFSFTEGAQVKSHSLHLNFQTRKKQAHSTVLPVPNTQQFSRQSSTETYRDFFRKGNIINIPASVSVDTFGCQTHKHRVPHWNEILHSTKVS